MSDFELDGQYSGYLVDQHITDHHESFLTKFDPEAYASFVKRVGAASAMLIACCHNGNCYYPTKVGKPHPNLKGRDVFGEQVRICRRDGIIPRAYYTIVYQRHAARSNPDWRVSQVDGAQNYRRSWYNCPNSPGYREHVLAHVAEIAAYDIASLFIDMTFWPGVCVCAHCRAKYLKEAGVEIPMTINWDDPAWVRFQRSRERWMTQFAHAITDAIHAVNPHIAVSHQFSPCILGWMYGQSESLALASDMPSGDFYGGKHQHRFGAKVLAAFTNKLPYEFMASKGVSLYDHTSRKSDDELLCSYATTLANAGACLIIDALNPDGTIEPSFYDHLDKVTGQLTPFKKAIETHKPAIEADTGLYFSMASQIRRDHNGVSLRDVMNPINNMLAISDLRPMNETLGTSVLLNRTKTPYRVVTGKSDFAGLRHIIINDATFLSADECNKLREFVRNGGTLFATGMTSFRDLDGHTTGDFALADVFGVTFADRFTRQWSYAALDSGEYLSCRTPGPVVNATTAKVLARLCEPIFDPNDFEHFAAYHSNPPGPVGPHAAVTVNTFGRGKCVYYYGSSLVQQEHSPQTFGADLFKKYLPSGTVKATNAPHAVEITLLCSTTAHAYLLCLVNWQEELPNIPLPGVQVTLTLPNGVKAKSFRRVSDGASIDAMAASDGFTVNIGRLDTVEMIEILAEG